MWQKEDIIKEAKNAGIIDGYVNDSELETLQKIANELGMEHYNGLSNEDTDELQRRMRAYRNQLQNNGGAMGNNSYPSAPSLLSRNNLRSDFSLPINKNKNGDRSIFDHHQRRNLGVKTKSNSNENSDSNSKNSGIGSQKIQRSLANKAYNLMQSRKRKHKENSNYNSVEGDSESDSNFDDSNENLFGHDMIRSIRKRIMMVKVALLGLALFGFVFLILLAAEIVSGGTALQSIPIAASSTYGTDRFESVTKEDSLSHDDEISYYKKLNSIYNQYDGSVNINYVNAILLELYYEKDFEPDKDKIEDSMGIDFVKMTNMVDIVAKIINDTDSIDYEIDGSIYSVLKNNSVIIDYYKNVTKTSTIDDVLTRAFELALQIDVMDNYDDTVLTSETEVSNNPTSPPSSKPTTTPTPTTKPSNNSTPTPTSSSKPTSPPSSKPTTTPTPTAKPTSAPSVNSTTTSIGEYIADSIYGNASNLNSDTVKAYTIAYSTNLVANNKNLNINSNIASASNAKCSAKKGCSYDSNGNLVSGAGENNGKNNEQYNGGYFYKRPLSNDEQAALDTDINSVFGNVLVNSNGKYPSVDVSKIDGLIGNYKTILNSAYGSTYKLKNIGENSYVLDVNYGTNRVVTSVIFYDQNDYTGTNFCGKKRETIKTSGCGITSMAMIVSTYEHSNQYTPIVMMNAARNMGYCGTGITGTSPGFFGREASTMKYKYTYASKYNKKDLNTVLKHLSQGHLVIAHMGPGRFTGGGHYMVLGGIDPATKKVYVFDPNNKSNKAWRKTGNGWYSFNDVIVKEAWGFYIIWKG